MASATSRCSRGIPEQNSASRATAVVLNSAAMSGNALNSSKERELQALEFIRSYTSTRGYPPASRELANHLQMSKSGTFGLVARLQQDGKLKTGRGQHMLVLTKEENDSGRDGGNAQGGGHDSRADVLAASDSSGAVRPVDRRSGRRDEAGLWRKPDFQTRVGRSLPSRARSYRNPRIGVNVSLYQVKSRDPNHQIELGWSTEIGGYWAVIYEADGSGEIDMFGVEYQRRNIEYQNPRTGEMTVFTVERPELRSLVDLLVVTKDYVRWEDEQETRRKLRDDPLVVSIERTPGASDNNVVAWLMDTVEDAPPPSRRMHSRRSPFRDRGSEGLERGLQ